MIKLCLILTMFSFILVSPGAFAGAKVYMSNGTTVIGNLVPSGIADYGNNIIVAADVTTGAQYHVIQSYQSVIKGQILYSDASCTTPFMVVDSGYSLQNKIYTDGFSIVYFKANATTDGGQSYRYYRNLGGACTDTGTYMSSGTAWEISGTASIYPTTAGISLPNPRFCDTAATGPANVNANCVIK